MRNADRLKNLNLRMVDGLMYPAVHGILAKAIDPKVTQCFAGHLALSRMVVYEYIENQLGKFQVSFILDWMGEYTV